jgi:dihydroorotase-like cyclic amidohydrolase
VIHDLNTVGGTVATAKKTIEAGIKINQEKITAISGENDLPPAREVLYVQGCIIMPRMVDSHVHIRASSFSYSENFQKGGLSRSYSPLVTRVSA